MLVGPLQQPIVVCRTDYLSDMVAGNLNLLKTGTLKILIETLRGLKKPGYIARPVLCTSIELVCVFCLFLVFCRRAQ